MIIKPFPYCTRRTFVAGALASLLLPGCSNSGQRVLRAAELHPYDYPTALSVIAMGEHLAELSAGELSIELYAGSQLGSERDALELATIGGIDIARVALAPLNAFEPMTFIPSLPFMFTDPNHMRAAMAGGPGQKVMASLEKHGLKGLCFYDSGSRSMYNTRRPIRTPDDMQGLKIRVQNSDLYVALMEALGANATPMPPDEVYQALVQGVVDGAENNWPTYQSGRHYEVAKFYSLTRHVIAPEVLVMSMVTWKTLSDIQQEYVMQAAAQSAQLMHRLWDAKVVEAEKIVRASGVAVNAVDDQTAFVDLVQPVWQKYIMTAGQAELVAEIRHIGDALKSQANAAAVPLAPMVATASATVTSRGADAG